MLYIITPSTPTEYHKKLYDYLGTLPHNEHILLISDFNAPDIEWDTYSYTCFNSELLCDFVVDYNLTQFIDKQLVSTTIYSTLLYITNMDNLIQDISIHPAEDFIIQSDHLMITFSLTTLQNHQRTKLHIQVKSRTILKQTGMAWTISSLTIMLRCPRITSSQM